MTFFRELPKTKTPLTDIIIIIVFSILLSAASYSWSILAYFPPTGDYASHFIEAAAFHNAMQRAQGLSCLITALIWPSAYPAGVYLAAHIYMLFAGSGINQILQSQIVFIPIFTASLYYIARPRLGVIAGISAILISSIIPETFLSTDHYIVDHAQSAFVCLIICLLVNFFSFNNRFHSICIGAAIGLGTLCKYTVFSFVLLPFIATTVVALNRERNGKKFNTLLFAKHAASMALAILIPYTASKLISIFIINETLRKIILGGIFFPETAIWLFYLSLACWTIWIAMILILRKHSEVMANIFLVPASAYILGYPWFICNSSLVSARSAALSNWLLSHFNTDYINSLLHEHYMVFPNLAFFILFIACLIFILLPISTIEERIVAASLLALPPTGMALGIAVRYTEPCFILSAVLVTMVVSRIRCGHYLALLISLHIFIGRILFPIQCGNNSAYNIENDSNWIHSLTRSMNCTGYNFSPSKSSFDIAMDIAPHLCVANQASVILITYNKELPTFCFDFYEGLQLWSELNHLRIVPVILQPETQSFFVPFKNNLASLAAGLKNSFPELLEIQGNLTYENYFDRILPTDRIDYIILPSLPGNQGKAKLSDKIIKEYLGDNAYLKEKEYDCFNISIWSKEPINF